MKAAIVIFGALSAIILGLMILVTAGFAIIDLVEQDSWVGSFTWSKNLFVGAAGGFVLYLTTRHLIKASRSKDLGGCLFVCAVNLITAAFLGKIWMETPMFP
tara:strand:- start:2329 stop:2634 length:306 start_codon:yes stop_codon:yes gene_type:complete